MFSITLLRRKLNRMTYFLSFFFTIVDCGMRIGINMVVCSYSWLSLVIFFDFYLSRQYTVYVITSDVKLYSFQFRRSIKKKITRYSVTIRIRILWNLQRTSSTKYFRHVPNIWSNPLRGLSFPWRWTYLLEKSLTRLIFHFQFE